MLVRLLQRFACFDLAQEESDPSAVPPPGYAKTLGTNGQDKVKIRSHLTLFVEVRRHNCPRSHPCNNAHWNTGRSMGPNALCRGN